MIEPDTVDWLRHELSELETELLARLPTNGPLAERFRGVVNVVRAVLDANEPDRPVRKIHTRIRRSRS